MDLSPLNKLPGELRNRIYELVVDFPQGLHLCKLNSRTKFFSWHTHNYPSQKPGFDDVMALSTTCKQIRKESLGIFYSSNTFTFYPRFWVFGFKMTRAQIRSYCKDLSILRQWLKSIGKVNAASIRKLILDLGEWETDAVHTVYSRGTERHMKTNRSDLSSTEWWQMPRKLERKMIHPHVKPDCISICVQLNSLPNTLQIRNFRSSWRDLAGSEERQKLPPWLDYYTLYSISATNRLEAKRQIQQVYTQQEEQVDEYLKQQSVPCFDEMLPIFRATSELNRDALLCAIGEKVKDQQNDVANRVAALKVD